MAINNAQDFIKKAFQKIGILAEGEPGSASQMNDAFDDLNIMIGSWSGRNLLTIAQIQESFAITAGIGTYTIGPSVVAPNFITSKPFNILSAFIRDASLIDTPIDIVSRETYNAITDKTSSGRPDRLFYDPGETQQINQIGTVYLNPVPDAITAYTLFLISEKPFTEFSNLVSYVSFPPSYKKAIIYNLAMELAPGYGISVSAEVIKGANESLAIIETINANNKKEFMKTVLPMSNRKSNILTGS